jgi:hypothetical protein
MYSFYKSKGFYVFLISAISFFVLNLVEDLIHFNIGRNRNLEDITVYLPEKSEWIYVIGVMIIFSILQGLVTYYFDNYI